MGNCFATIMSNIIYFSEKFAMMLSFTSLVGCAIICMVSMLAFGIGLGYNYSFVDNRAKHTYIAAQYKKTRPANYYGPGYYVPTTKTPKKNKLARKSLIAQYIKEETNELPLPFAPPRTFLPMLENNLPTNSPVDLIRDEFPLPKNRVKVLHTATEKKLEQLYFNIATPRKFSFDLNSHYNSTTEMTIDVSTGTKFDKYDRKEDNRKEDKNDVFNETDDSEKNESVPVAVNVSKTHNDSAVPFVIKTMMQPSQLSEWLSRLQQANKTFAVQVATD